MSSSRAATPMVVAAGEPSTVAAAATALRRGLVVAIPTDTVYGMAAALDRPDAIARLFELKDRPHDKAIPVLLADEGALHHVAEIVPEPAQALMRRFWPGALTIVVPAHAGLPAEVTSVAADGTRTVAVRVPDMPIARAILAAAGGALAVTSANRSGEPPAVDAGAVMRLGEASPDLVIDGGAAPLRAPSTVALALAGETRVLREGAISLAEIADALAQTDAGCGPGSPYAV